MSDISDMTTDLELFPAIKKLLFDLGMSRTLCEKMSGRIGCSSSLTRWMFAEHICHRAARCLKSVPGILSEGSTMTKAHEDLYHSSICDVLEQTGNTRRRFDCCE